MNVVESLPPAVAEAARDEGMEVERGGGEEDLITGGGVMPFDPALGCCQQRSFLFGVSS